jgi:hypothetical protein
MYGNFYVLISANMGIAGMPPFFVVTQEPIVLANLAIRTKSPSVSSDIFFDFVLIRTTLQLRKHLLLL